MVSRRGRPFELDAVLVLARQEREAVNSTSRGPAASGEPATVQSPSTMRSRVDADRYGVGLFSPESSATATR